MTEPGVFAHPFMYWVGMDTDPRTTPEALAEFNRFYSTVHVHEVIAAHPGFVSVTRWELVDSNSTTGPRWLAIYEMENEAAAEQYVKDNARPWLHRRKYSPWPAARKRAKTVWRLLWHQLGAPSAVDEAPNSLELVGTNQRPDTDVTVLELYRDFAHPAPGAPRYCAVNSTEAARSDVLWHLSYRRIPEPE